MASKLALAGAVPRAFPRVFPAPVPRPGPGATEVLDHTCRLLVRALPRVLRRPENAALREALTDACSAATQAYRQVRVRREARPICLQPTVEALRRANRQLRTVLAEPAEAAVLVRAARDAAVLAVLLSLRLAAYSGPGNS